MMKYKNCPFCKSNKIEYIEENVLCCHECNSCAYADIWNERPIEDKLKEKITKLETENFELQENIDQLNDIINNIRQKIGEDNNPLYTKQMFYLNEILENRGYHIDYKSMADNCYRLTIAHELGIRTFEFQCITQELVWHVLNALYTDHVIYMDIENNDVFYFDESVYLHLRKIIGFNDNLKEVFKKLKIKY